MKECTFLFNTATFEQKIFIFEPEIVDISSFWDGFRCEVRRVSS